MSVAVIHADKPARTIRRLSAQSVVQAFGYLLGKSPQLAAGQLRAARQVRQNRDALIAAAEQNRSIAAAAP